MNTVIEPVYDADTDELIGHNFNDELGDQVMQSLLFNNSFLPGIRRVTYNLKTTDVRTVLDADGNPVKNEDGSVKHETVDVEPVLTTIVDFKDGTRSIVKNCAKDKIVLVPEKVTSIAGNTVEVMTAGHESREIGLLYAILKRAVCKFDEKGVVDGAGFAKFLRETVKGAYRQDVETALAKADKAARKQPKDAPAADRPVKKMRLVDTVRKLSETVDTLAKALMEKQA